jgi:hypothetical protein
MAFMLIGLTTLYLADVVRAQRGNIIPQS